MENYNKRREVQPFRSPQHNQIYGAYERSYYGNSQTKEGYDSQRIGIFKREIQNYKNKIQQQQKSQTFFTPHRFSSSQHIQHEIYMKKLEIQQEKQQLKQQRKFLRQQRKYRKFLNSKKLQGIENSTLIKRRVSMALSLSTGLSSQEILEKQEKFEQNKSNWSELIKLLASPKETQYQSQFNILKKAQSTKSSRINFFKSQIEFNKSMSFVQQNQENNGDGEASGEKKNGGFDNCLQFLEKRQDFKQICKISPEDQETELIQEPLEFWDNCDQEGEEQQLFRSQQDKNQEKEDSFQAKNGKEFQMNYNENFNNKTTSLEDSFDSLLSVPSEEDQNLDQDQDCYQIKFATEKTISQGQKNKYFSYQNSLKDSIIDDKKFYSSTKLNRNKNKIKVTQFKNFNKFL